MMDLYSQQEKLLVDSLLRPNAATRFGEAHGFSSVSSSADYRKAVPLHTYEDLRPWVDRLLSGESEVLTRERTIAFFKTSGSLSKPKLIPVTTSLMRQKVACFGKFWGQVYEQYPGIRHGMMVSNFTDASAPEPTDIGVDVYSESGFWARRGRSMNTLERWPLPTEVRRISNSQARLYATARILLQSPLRCIMCLNPSTLLQFCRTVVDQTDSLSDGLLDGSWGSAAPDISACMTPDDHEALLAHLKSDAAAADRLRSGVQQSQTPRLIDLWPELDLIICWQSTVVQPYFEQLAGFLDNANVRDYITQSSECMMAIPYKDSVSGGQLAYEAHFFEFIPEASTEHSQPDTLLAHELEHGQRYELVVTTGGGLYRYRMGDCMRVSRSGNGVPDIEFLYRVGRTSSMTGEKLTEHQVMDAARHAVDRAGVQPEEFLCYPCSGATPHYAVLFDPGSRDVADVDIQSWVEHFDQGLALANTEYEDKCDSGRLGRMRAYRVPGGSLLSGRHARRAAGVSEEQVKAEVLSAETDLHTQRGAVECTR